MPFWKIAWRNIEQRGLASSLTALSMALGVAVMIAVLVIHSVAVRQFEQDAQGYHLIVGGKGGALQLVLSTVYYLGQPLYPIPYTYYEKFLPGGEFADYTEVAVPECLGDSYVAPNNEVFRIVATTPDLVRQDPIRRECPTARRSATSSAPADATSKTPPRSKAKRSNKPPSKRWSARLRQPAPESKSATRSIPRMASAARDTSTTPSPSSASSSRLAPPTTGPYSSTSRASTCSKGTLSPAKKSTKTSMNMSTSIMSTTSPCRLTSAK